MQGADFPYQGHGQSQEHLADFAGSRVTTCAACPLGAELFVSPDIAVEVLLERLVENGGFGMSRAVNSRRFASQSEVRALAAQIISCR